MSKQKKALKKYRKAISRETLLVDALLKHQQDSQMVVNNPPDTLRLKCHDGGVHFGADPFDSTGYVGKHQEDDGHIMVVGGPGCHKTTGITLPTILTWQGTFVAVDVKGDISDFCLRHQQEIAYPISIIDFTNHEHEYSVHFDPFLQLRQGGEDELLSNARELAISIVPLRDDDREPFWTLGAQNILTAIILYAVGKGLNFNTMIQMILHTPVEKLRKAIEGSGNNAARSFINQYPIDLSGSEDKTLRGSFIEAVNALHVFEDPNIQKVFEEQENSVNLNRDIQSGNFVIRIPESKISQWGGAVRLILRQLFSTLSQRPEKYSRAGRCQLPFLLLWDEMPRFGKFEDLPNAFSTLRSKNVTICATVQSFAQLDCIYGPSIRRVLVDCCAFLVIGAVQDVETQEYCSRLIGSCPVWEPSVGENYYPSREEFTYNRNLNFCRKPIFYPEDFSTLHDFIVATPFGKFCIKKNPLFEKPGLSLYRSNNRSIQQKGGYDFLELSGNFSR